MSDNIGTILTALVLLVIVTAVIIKIYRDKKKNNSEGVCAGCPCGCCDSGLPQKKSAL
jgi:hypothetical protein